MSRFVWPNLFTLRVSGLAQTANQKVLETVRAKYFPQSRLSNPVALRWLHDSKLGIPREPFRVYRRPRNIGDAAALTPLIAKVTATVQPQTYPIVPGGDAAYLVVAVVTLSAASSVTLEALDSTGRAIPAQTLTLTASGTVEFRCPGIAAMRISGTGTGSVGPVTALGETAYANLAGWIPIETVGLPLLNDEIGSSYRTNPQGFWPTPIQPPTLDGVAASIQRTTIAGLLQLPPPATGIADFPLPVWPVPVPAAYVANLRGTTPLLVIDGVTNSIVSVNVGVGPLSVAVNAAGNRVYVANQGSNNLTVIDGATNAAIATVATGISPVCVAVNQPASRIYVANFQSDKLTVIDTATNAVAATVPTGRHPVSVAVNTIANKIYVANQGSDTVTVIDGATNSAAPVNTGTQPIAVAVNAVTNKIYVANYLGGSVTVMDGATNATTTVNVGTNPFSLAVNQATNKIYVANRGSNDVSVIDGATNNACTVSVGSNPVCVAVNQATNKIYVANRGGNTVTVIDGATNATTIVSVGSNPVFLAVNAAANRIYVANRGSSDITVVAGATNSTTAVGVGSALVSMGVNPTSNKIYAAGAGSGNLIPMIEHCLQNTDDANPSKMQSDYLETVTLDGIKQSGAPGPVDPGRPTTASLPVTGIAMMAAGTDSFAAVSLGYGTVDLPPDTAGKINSTGALATRPAGAVLFGTPVTLTATFKAVGGDLIPSGTITFTDSNTTLGTATLNATGVATLTTSALQPGNNKTLTANWPGDAQFNPPNSPPSATITVNPPLSPVPPSTLPVTSAMNVAAAVPPAGLRIGTPTTKPVATTPATAAVYNNGGTAATLSIPYTLAGAATPAPKQSFQVFDGATQIGTVSLAANPAVFTLPASVYQGVGVHTLSVKYPSGDPNYAPSTSSSVLFYVTKFSPAVAASGFSVNPVAGANITLGGTVSAPGVGNGAAPVTGTLTFSAAGVTLGSCTPAGGSCSITGNYPALAAGANNIAIAYSGDANYNPASTTGIVVVQPPPPPRPAVDNYGDYDYMVTAPFTFPFGLTQTLAALSTGQPPVEAPVGLESERKQVYAPLARNARAGAAIRVSWQPPSIPQGYGILASRAPNQSEVLNAARPTPVQGYDPFIGLAPSNPDPNTPPDQQMPNFSDTACALPLSFPDIDNRYLVAGLNVFGQWSNWVKTNTPLSAAPVTKLGLRSAEFLMDVAGAAGHLVPATMRIEFSWDWEDRAPGQIRFTGHFVPAPATTLGTPPDFTPDLSGFATQSTGPAGPPAILTFTYTSPGPDTVDSTAVIPVIDSGHSSDGPVQIVQAGPQPPPTPPPPNPKQVQYRVDIKNFTLDFSTADEIDFFLYATATEQIRPNQWSEPTEPNDPSDPLHPTRITGKIVRAMDPVPPTVIFSPPPISWTALPDVTGMARGVLEWTPDPKAAGYFVWEATESALRQILQPETPDPLPSEPAVSRAATLQTWLQSQQDASLQGFARLTKDPIPSSRTEINLPGAASTLYVYRISAISAANVEAPRSPQIAIFGVPRRDVPGIPRLMLRRPPKQAEIQPPGIQVVALPVGSGAVPHGYRVFRVRSAALSHDGSTMGPAKIDESADWNDYPASTTGALLSGAALADAQAGNKVLYGKSVIDTAAIPSWYPYYYRAIAIGKEDDPPNGVYRGESDFSSVQSAYALPTDPPMMASYSISVSLLWQSALVAVTTDLPAAEPSPVGPARVELFLTPPAVKPAKLVTTTVLSSAPEAIAVGTLGLPVHPPVPLGDVTPPPPIVPPPATMRRSAPAADGSWTLYVLVPYTSAEQKHYQLRLTDPLARRSSILF